MYKKANKILSQTESPLNYYSVHAHSQNIYVIMRRGVVFCCVIQNQIYIIKMAKIFN